MTHAVDRTGIDPALIEGSTWGVGYFAHVTGGNLDLRCLRGVGVLPNVALWGGGQGAAGLFEIF